MLEKRSRTIKATKAALREFKRLGGTLVRGMDPKTTIWNRAARITSSGPDKYIIYIPKQKDYRKLPFLPRLVHRFSPPVKKITSTPRSTFLHEFGHLQHFRKSPSSYNRFSGILDSPIKKSMRALDRERGANLSTLRFMRKHIKDSLVRKRESAAFRKEVEPGYKTYADPFKIINKVRPRKLKTLGFKTKRMSMVE